MLIEFDLNEIVFIIILSSS